jgi:hypothetical protein
MIVLASAAFAGTAQFAARANAIQQAATTAIGTRTFAANLHGAVRAAVATVVATRTFSANPIINGCALEPEGRQMYRPFVDRSMYRPFVDRAMSRPDTE